MAVARADGVHPRDRPTEDFKVIEVLQVGGCPPCRENCKAEFQVLEHRLGLRVALAPMAIGFTTDNSASANCCVKSCSSVMAASVQRWGL